MKRAWWGKPGQKQEYRNRFPELALGVAPPGTAGHNQWIGPPAAPTSLTVGVFLHPEQFWQQWDKSAWEWAKRSPLPAVAPLPPIDPNDPARAAAAERVRRSMLLAAQAAQSEPAGGWAQASPPAASEGGACPSAITADWLSGYPWSLQVYPHRAVLLPRLRRRNQPVAAPVRSPIRSSMAGSIARMSRATHALEWASASPTHMLTLTLPPAAWEHLPSDSERIANWERAKSHWLRMLSDRMRGSGSGWLWFVEFQRRGAPHLHVLIELSTDHLPVPQYEGWQRWLTDSWSRCLGIPAPYATRIEALRERDFRYARSYALKSDQKSFPFPGPWRRVWGCGGSYSGALARAEAQRVQFVLSDVAAYILAWAMGLSSSAGILPAPSHHARLLHAGSRGLDMREGPGLPVRSDGSLPRESLFCWNILTGTAPDPLAWHGSQRVDSLLSLLEGLPTLSLLHGPLLDSG